MALSMGAFDESDGHKAFYMAPEVRGRELSCLGGSGPQDLRPESWGARTQHEGGRPIEDIERVICNI